MMRSPTEAAKGRSRYENPAGRFFTSAPLWLRGGGVAALNFVQYFMWKIKYSAPADMGIVTGSAAIAICGAVTLVVAHCLRDLEERVRRLESASGTKGRHG
jgi:hypothetical protein